MRWITNCLAVMLISAAGLAMSGCLAVAAAAGAGAGVAYAKGDLEAIVDGTPPEVAAAAEAALEEMGMPVYSSTATALDGVVKSEAADGDNVKISIERRTDDTSKVWIRVSAFGDQSRSMAILERIKANLAIE